MTCSFPTSANLVTCKPCTSVLPNWDASLVAGLPIPRINSLLKNEMNCAGIEIKESVGEGEIVTTSMSVNCATKKDILATSAQLRALQQVLDLRAKRPSWVRNLMWTDLDLGISWAALWTESASPLPPDEFRNKEAVNTIINNPHLFKIMTPINTPRFKEFLSKHPNQLFVDSVINGLTHRFWLFMHTNYGTYPTTLDDSGVPPKTSKQISFLSNQVQTESDANQYSVPFGPDLLLGMYSTPILAVPRKGKLHLCNHQSHGEFSLNSMIKRDDITGFKLDRICELGESLCLFRHQHGDKPLVLFKSDIKATYCQIPLHFLWQIKRVITFDGLRCVDCAACFSSQSSQIIFMAFMGLVT